MLPLHLFPPLKKLERYTLHQISHSWEWRLHVPKPAAFRGNEHMREDRDTVSSKWAPCKVHNQGPERRLSGLEWGVGWGSGYLLPL